ncbi:hypothetical protein Vadar_033769 [Vaccinium darrowii]|uniref:Uncharacterized protein n=1 Tax=Vaccinium darrowii TaxID=229202 RepID=A0ACB7YRC4_9ERIC|nr:hypothetical protein Vadar_033769 [Vaccinium darrowii]
MVSFGEAAGLAEGVNCTADFERIREVATEAQVVKKVKGSVNIIVHGAEPVNLFGPVIPVGYAHFSFIWFTRWLWWQRGKERESDLVMVLIGVLGDRNAKINMTTFTCFGDALN